MTRRLLPSRLEDADYLTVMNNLSNNCTTVNCISKSLLSYVDQFFCSMNLLSLEEMSLYAYPLGCRVVYSRTNDATCVASVEIVCRIEKVFTLQPLTGAISDDGKSPERWPYVMLITNILQ